MSKNSKTANPATGVGAAKIRSIVSVPLVGESPKGGWSAEIRPEDSIHSLIAVHTDAGITGHGSVFTNGGLVAAALKVLAGVTLREYTEQWMKHRDLTPKTRALYTRLLNSRILPALGNETLRAVAAQIDARNTRLAVPYTYLHPGSLCSSVET